MAGSIWRTLVSAPKLTVGGQAVIEGVMMRSRDRLAIAVRRPDGEIVLEERPWFSLTKAAWLRKPFLRGFPVLLETMINGIKALNYSATQALDEEEDGEISTWHLVLTLMLAVGAALGIFVALPHGLSVLMQWLGLSGDVNDLSFHVWDGLFRIIAFVGYILLISLMPDIKRVFQYHGAEHKVIWGYESGQKLDPASVRLNSRLHPRCGTAFLLFVLAVSIIIYTILVPWLLTFYTPENFVAKHAYIVGMKLLFMVPISSIAYEIIKLAGRFNNNLLCKALCWPGLALQALTTREPDDDQIEVAVAALNCALNKEGSV